MGAAPYLRENGIAIELIFDGHTGSKIREPRSPISDVTHQIWCSKPNMAIKWRVILTRARPNRKKKRQKVGEF